MIQFAGVAVHPPHFVRCGWRRLDRGADAPGDFLRLICPAALHVQYRYACGGVDRIHQRIACFSVFALVRFVVELNHAKGLHGHRITEHEVCVLGADAIKRGASLRLAEAFSYLNQVADADLRHHHRLRRPSRVIGVREYAYYYPVEVQFRGAQQAVGTHVLVGVCRLRSAGRELDALLASLSALAFALVCAG